MDVGSSIPSLRAERSNPSFFVHYLEKDGLPRLLRRLAMTKWRVNGRSHLLLLTGKPPDQSA
jgi:hypothetical protein